MGRNELSKDRERNMKRRLRQNTGNIAGDWRDGRSKGALPLPWIARGFLKNEAHQTVKRLFPGKLWRSHPEEICSLKLSGQLLARASLGGQTRRLQPPMTGG